MIMTPHAQARFILMRRVRSPRMKISRIPEGGRMKSTMHVKNVSVLIVCSVGPMNMSNAATYVAA
jgi:hypothetical protein